MGELESVPFFLHVCKFTNLPRTVVPSSQICWLPFIGSNCLIVTICCSIVMQFHPTYLYEMCSSFLGAYWALCLSSIEVVFLIKSIKMKSFRVPLLLYYASECLDLTLSVL